MKNFVLIVVGSLIVAGPVLAVPALQEVTANQKLAKAARITMDEARATALKRAPGTVESAELEKEHGRLVYSFDIRNAKGTITEVQVSAISGRVVRVEHENKKKEAAEKKKEAGEKKH